MKIERALRWATEHRAAVIVGLVVLTGLAGLGLSRQDPRRWVDNGVDVWFVQGDPALAAYHRFQETFGNDEAIYVALRFADGVWTPKALEVLRRTTARLEAVAGIRRVLGVPTARVVSLRGAGLDVSPLLPQAAVQSAEQVSAIRQRFERDPLLGELLMADGDRTTVLVAQLESMDNIDAKRDEIVTGVEQALLPTRGQAGVAVHMAGIGVMYNALNRISQTEGAVFVLLSNTLIFVLLLLLFRRVGPVILTMLAVGAASVWLFGAFIGAGRSINMVTMILPTLVLILGVADSVHILEHRAQHPQESPAKVLSFMFWPCLFTSLTTMAGFASLGTSRMAVVRDLGLYGALGVGLALVATLALSALALRWPIVTPRHPAKPGTGWVAQVLRRTADLAIRSRHAVLAGTLLVVLGGAYGVSHLDVDTLSVAFLPADHPVRVDSQAMESLLGPFTPLELTVDSGKPDGLKDPAVLAAIARWQKTMEADGRVRSSVSLADVIPRLHQVWSEGSYELPGSADQVWQLLELYEADPDNERAHLVDKAYQVARVTVAVPVLSARNYRNLTRHLLKVGRAQMPAGVTLAASGYLPLYVKMMDYIVESQLVSFGLAFVVVFVLIGLLFKSLRMAALSVLPNVLPLFVTLGVMGLAGIRLDVATVTITAIVIGIAVDDTIHYLYRFRTELARCAGDHAEAVRRTSATAGRAIWATTLILCLGFSVLAGASVKSVSYFGLLTALALAVAVVGDLLVLPALLVSLKPKL